MLKYIWLILVFILCSYGGISLGSGYLKRKRDLTEVNKCITILQNEVLYKSTPIPHALMELSFRCEGRFKKLLSETSNLLIIGEKEEVYDAFSDTYNNCKNEFYFQSEDEKVIGDFLKVLGNSGVYGQEKIFELVKSNLEVNLDEATKVANKNYKLYSCLGALIGAMIVIFLV